MGKRVQLSCFAEMVDRSAGGRWWHHGCWRVEEEGRALNGRLRLHPGKEVDGERYREGRVETITRQGIVRHRNNT